MVAKDKCEQSTDAEEIGFISNEYLKPFTGPKLTTETSTAEDSQGNLVSHDVTSAWMQYVVVEDYLTKDPRQLCLRKDETLVVIEKSEDGN